MRLSKSVPKAGSKRKEHCLLVKQMFWLPIGFVLLIWLVHLFFPFMHAVQCAAALSRRTRHSFGLIFGRLTSWESISSRVTYHRILGRGHWGHCRTRQLWPPNTWIGRHWLTRSWRRRRTGHRLGGYGLLDVFTGSRSTASERWEVVSISWMSGGRKMTFCRRQCRPLVPIVGYWVVRSTLQ